MNVPFPHSPLTQPGFEEGDWVAHVSGSFANGGDFGRIARLEGSDAFVHVGDDTIQVPITQIVMAL